MVTTGAAVRADGVRQHNLSAVASLIHAHGALSRADLTARLGLNRSTIGVLVSELCGLGVVAESRPHMRQGVGRPSHVVGPHPHGPYALAADVDVDGVSMTAVGLGGRELSRCYTHLVSTAPERVAEQIADMAKDMSAGSAMGWLAALGVSVPGTVSTDEEVVGLAPNLEWRDVELKRLLDARLATGMHIRIGNDADLGVRAEHTRGAARTFDNVLYIHGRTGIGGGIIADGRPLHGTRGAAGEIGHMVVDQGGIRCHCGRRGCLETVIGEHHLVEQSGRSGDHADALHHLLTDPDPEPEARSAIERACRWLAFGLTNAATLLNPEVIVLGGYLAVLMQHYGSVVEGAFAELSTPANAADVVLRPAGLGTNSALVGAGELAFERFLLDPTRPRPPG